MNACRHATVVETGLVPGDQPIRYTRCVSCGLRFCEVSSSTHAFAEARSMERFYADEAYRRFSRAPSRAGFVAASRVASLPVPQPVTGRPGDNVGGLHSFEDSFATEVPA